MKFEDILGHLKAGLELAQQAAAVAAQLGIPGAGPAATIAREVADIGQVAIDRIKDGALVATSEDRAEIDAVLTKLRALNDAEDAEALAG